MIFNKALLAFLSLAILFISLTSALPLEDARKAEIMEFAQLHNLTDLLTQDPYPLICNKKPLPINEIDACAKNLQARGDELLKIEGPNGFYHLCAGPHVYVNGRALGEVYAEAKAVNCGNVVQFILLVCGQAGGSWSANGDKGDESFIVHVNDMWT